MSTAISWGLDRQMKVYLAGLQGQRASIPFSIEELERQAQARMTAEAYGYVAGSAGSESTAR
ncbi:MAG TPA: hypothetical protein PKD72_12400, partial [Gemmatales bacterium]|nr:hypothetical protein [Gemmatales bacterium]